MSYTEDADDYPGLQDAAHGAGRPSPAPAQGPGQDHGPGASSTPPSPPSPGAPSLDARVDAVALAYLEAQMPPPYGPGGLEVDIRVRHGDTAWLSLLERARQHAREFLAMHGAMFVFDLAEAENRLLAGIQPMRPFPEKDHTS